MHGLSHAAACKGMCTPSHMVASLEQPLLLTGILQEHLQARVLLRALQ
jgi:hypothetical protein